MNKIDVASKELNNSAAAWPRITKFYMDIHANPLYSHTGYDVTSYFRSAFLLQFESMTESDGFVSNLVARRFTCPNQLVGFLLSVYTVLISFQY